MSLGENIKKRRLELKMTQQELAESLGLKSRSSIAKIEKDITSLPHNKIISLSHILNVSIDYLLTGTLKEDKKDNRVYGTDATNAIDYSAITDSVKCIAIILAGGSSRKNKYGTPFQFVTVNKKPIFLYTLENYQNHPLINQIYIVCLNGWEETVSAYAKQYNITKLSGIIPAGASGVLSTKNAIEWLSNSCNTWDIIAIQEATRPFTDPETITNGIRCCKQYGSAISYERLDKLTPFIVNASNSEIQHIDSSSLINLQSPEIYSYGFLKYSFLQASNNGHPFSETITAVFLHNIGKKLQFYESSNNNYKIGNEEDLSLLKTR